MGILKWFTRRHSSWTALDTYEGRETASGARVNDTTALGIPAVFACVRVLAESIAAMPLITYRRLDSGDRERARDFSLYRILHDSPNPLMTASEFWEMTVGHLALRGNAYAYVERAAGEVVGIWPLHPDRVTVEVDGRRLLYVHQGDDAERRYRMEDILHIRGLSADGVIGYSPLTLCRDTFGHALSIRQYSATYFKNDGAPGGILSTPNTLSDAAYKNLRDSWKQGYQGAKNAHRVAILDGDLKWQQVGVSPEDSQMIESLKLSVVEIARIFRVPLNLVMDYERSTYSNVTEQNRSFLTHTLRPWLTRIEQALHKAVLTETERDHHFVEFLTQDLLRGDTKTRYEAYEIGLRAGFLQIDEVRKFENMNAIETTTDNKE